MKTPSPKKEEQKVLDREIKLAKEMERLGATIERIERLQPFSVFRNPKKFLIYSFLHGLTVGFASVLGATVLIALLIFLLKQIQFAPIVGNFVQEILSYIRPE